MRLNKFILNEAAKDQAMNTVLQESLHAVGFGITQLPKNKILTQENLNNPDLFKISYDKFCVVDASDTQIFDFLEKNKSWGESVINAVNAGRKSRWFKSNKYKFYRTKGVMGQIYDQFNRIKKDANINLANDKWNPGDIWASTLSSIPNFSNITELNSFISTNLNSGKLLSISLKKTKGKAKVEWQGPSESVEVVGYKVIKHPRSIFPTGIVIMTNKSNIGINFRSFRISKQADITGEILQLGGAARHGKVGAAKKKELVDKYRIPQMPKERIKNMTDDELIDAVISLWADCDYVFSEKDIQKNWEKRENDIQDRVGYWQSIIHALEIGAFLNMNSTVANDIVNQMYISGKSISEFSSEFIKIY